MNDAGGVAAAQPASNADNADRLAAVAAALRKRRSVRGYLPTPVPDADLHDLFATAQLAPSWCNIQPWRVVVTRPPATTRLTTALVAAAETTPMQSELPFITEFPSPYHEHRRACGLSLYSAMHIARDDKAGRRDAWLANYRAFGAPHVAIVSCDRRLGPYAYVDVGVWLGMLLTVASAKAIATCAMASLGTYPEVLRRELGIDPEQTILFGLALGYEDAAVPANACRTTRDSVDNNVRFL